MQTEYLQIDNIETGEHRSEHMKLTWLGTNSLLLEAAGEKIGIDPFVQMRGAENPNTLDDYRAADTFLITHGHFDHLAYIPFLIEEGDVTVFCSGTPARTLEPYDRENPCVVLVKPGMCFRIGGIEVRVLQGRHIHFDAKLIIRTLFSGRMVRYAGNLPLIIWGALHFREHRETLVYELCAEGRRIQILGSLGLADNEHYEPGADLLVMPYQGGSHLEEEADRILQVLQPARVLLTHFDDAFPPVSGKVDLRPLKKLLREKYPQIRVVRPTAGRTVYLK